MTFRLTVRNPAFPDDKEKAVYLTTAQLAQVRDYVTKCLRVKQEINESTIIDLCAIAGYQIEFGE